jgi:hypothetical protein
VYIHLLSHETDTTTEFALPVRHLAANCQGGYSGLRSGVATDRAAGHVVHRATGFVAGSRGFAGAVGRDSGDRRERWIRLAPAGEARFRLAVPAWEEAQARLRRWLGEKGWQELMEMSNQVTEMVTTEGDMS